MPTKARMEDPAIQRSLTHTWSGIENSVLAIIHAALPTASPRTMAVTR